MENTQNTLFLFSFVFCFRTNKTMNAVFFMISLLLLNINGFPFNITGQFWRKISKFFDRKEDIIRKKAKKVGSRYNILRKELLDSTKYPNARCLDGSQGGAFIQKSLSKRFKQKGISCNDIRYIRDVILPTTDFGSLTPKERRDLENKWIQQCKVQKNRFVLYVPGGFACFSVKSCVIF